MDEHSPPGEGRGSSNAPGRLMLGVAQRWTSIPLQGRGGGVALHLVASSCYRDQI